MVEPTNPIYEHFMASHRIAAQRSQCGLDLLKQARVCFPPRMQVNSVLRHGLEADEITAEAREWKATLMVIGTWMKSSRLLSIR